MKEVLLYYVVSVVLILKTKQFCGTFPALARTRDFNRDTSENSKGGFDFDCNSFVNYQKMDLAIQYMDGLRYQNSLVLNQSHMG